MATAEVHIENDGFRVTKWTIEPGGSIPMHQHDFDYVVVPLVTDTMHVVNADGTEMVVPIETSVPYTHNAGAEHTVENRGSNVIEFIEVEKLT